MSIYARKTGLVLSLLLWMSLFAAAPAWAVDFSVFEPPVVEEPEPEPVVIKDRFSVFENMNVPDTNITYDEAEQTEFLLEIAEPDPEYRGRIMPITDEDRQLLEKIVMGECNSSLEGSMLVAQCLRDGMIYGGFETAAQVKKAFSYYASSLTPNQNAVDAVKAVFDEGQSAVQHRILYFYAPGVTSSAFHESQLFIIEYGGHRYFDIR